jgi:hypothetical protein
MNAHTDSELNPWLTHVREGNLEKRIAPAGSFLKTLSQAAFRADPLNYVILRPALLQLKSKYPEYA